MASGRSGLSQFGGKCHWRPVDRGQGCPKQHKMHRTAAHFPPSLSKELSDPNVNSDEVEKLWLRETVRILPWKLQRRRNMEAEGYPPSRWQPGEPGWEEWGDRDDLPGWFQRSSGRPKGRDSSNLLRTLLQKLICKYFFGISWIPCLPSYRRPYGPNERSK